MADFKAQLGRADHPGLASQAERLARIVPGPKPSVTGQSLPPDSPGLLRPGARTGGGPWASCAGPTMRTASRH